MPRSTPLLPRRLLRRLLALTTLVALPLAGCGGEEGPSRFLSIGTGGTGGIYYPLGGALAARLSAGDTLRRFTAEVTGGSVENVNRVASGEIDLGFALAVTVHEAWAGGEGFDAPLERLRVVAPLYANVTHVLVRSGSGIGDVAELRGRRVSVGAAGSGTEQLARRLLEVHGLGYDDVEARFLSFAESSAALRDGALDAAILSVGFPAGAVLEALTAGAATLLPIDPERARAFQESHPYARPGVIPAGAYPGVEEDLPTVLMNNWVVSRDDLAPDVARQVLRVLGEDRRALVQVHPMAEGIDLADLSLSPIPLHPEAEAWRTGGGGP